MLWAFGRQMLEFVKGCLKIFWHGDAAGVDHDGIVYESLHDFLH